MATGLAIPLIANTTGGMQLVSGDENDSKVIRATLGSDENENAFQQGIGMGDGMIFDFADPTTRNRIETRLIDIFRRFQVLRRFILRGETLKWTEIPDAGEMELSFRFVNVETDQEHNFRQGFNRARGSTNEV